MGGGVRGGPGALGAPSDTAVHDVRTGRPLWSHPLDRKSWRAGTPGGLDTASHDPAIVGTAVLSMTADDRPQVTDLGTGVVRWTGAGGTVLLGLDGSTAVARDRGGLGDLVGLDAATGAPRWRVPWRGAALNAWAAVGGRFVYSNGDLSTVDLATGRPQWTVTGAGDLVGAGPDWIVAATTTAVALY